MSKLAEAISQLSPEQRAILEQRLQEKRKKQTQIDRILPRIDQSEFPLSAGQQRLWILHQLDPRSAAHNITEAFHLKGVLNIEAFEKSLDLIQRRHEVLRARFFVAGENSVAHPSKPKQDNTLLSEYAAGGMEPVQTIVAPEPYALSQIDLQSDSSDERFEIARQRIQNMARQPFNLAHEPLWRVQLFRLAQDENIFVLSMHHMLTDVWSFELFLQELGAHYAACANQETPTLAVLPIQYADFAWWQQRWLTESKATAQLAYWENKLAGDIAPLRLPTTRERTGLQQATAAQVTSTISSQILQGLEMLARKEGISLFSLLLSVFKATLYRYTEQQKMVVCSPVAGRRYSELEGLLGYFNNIVALCTDVSENQTLSALIQQVHQNVLEAHENQEVPFQQVCELPNLIRVPLSRALFTLQDALEASLNLPDITVTQLEVEAEIADFDLSIFIERQDNSLTIVTDYKKELFERQIIQGIVDDYLSVLKLLPENFHQEISTLPISRNSLCIERSEHAWPFNENPSTIHLQTNALSEDIHTNGHSLDRQHSSAAHLNGTCTHEIARQKTSSDLGTMSALEQSLPPVTVARTELEENLVEIWKQVLNLETVGIHQNFFALGGHSMLAVHLFSEIQQQITKAPVPSVQQLLQAPTVAQMAKALTNEEESPEWSPLTLIQPGTNVRPTLFCIHGAGGNVLIYRELATYLGPEQTVYGLQSQGLDGQQPLQTSVEEMAELYLRHIQEVQPRGPYMICGYCMGGTVALELAHQLREQGDEVAFLGFLETYNWANLREENFVDHAYYWWQKIVFHWRNFLLLDTPQKRMFLAEKWDALRQRTKVWRGSFQQILKRSQGNRVSEQAVHSDKALSATMTPEQILAAVWDNNDAVSMRYQPKPYAGRITCFRPRKEYTIYLSQDTGWEKFAQDGIENRTLPVYPAGMLLEPFVQKLANEMSDSIDKALQNVYSGDA
ncbi:hypothetical protein KFU94_61105 [Chloroflexi bacterium TSY]|nr:hypothetical protein [Chloroflexi bacterium TSY]